MSPIRLSTVLVALLATACTAIDPVSRGATENVSVQTNETALVFESAAGVWGGAVLRGEEYAWVAAALHVENKLAAWRVSADRVRSAPLLGDTGYHPDGVAVWDESSVAVAVEGIRRLQLWRIAGDRLVKEAELPTVFGARDVLVADLDGDGHRDVVLAPYAGKEVALMWGRGGFNFSEPQMLQGGASGWHPVAVDIDADGDLDLLWAELDTGVIRLARNGGSRNFAVSELHKVKGVTPRQLAVGDVNQDGRLDIAVAVEIGDAEVLLALPGGGFTSETIRPRGLGHIGVAVKADGTILLSNENEITLVKQSRTSWERRLLPAAGMPAPIALEHVDGDEYEDLVIYHSSGSGGVLVYFGPMWVQAEVLEPLTR